MFTARTLREGAPAIVIAAVVTALTAWWQPWAAIVPGLVLVFVIAFFRDPAVTVPADPAAIVAPATGKIVEILTVPESLYLGGEARRVAIFLSVFDVHVQCAPVAGTVQFEKYVRGRFLDVRDPQATVVNEHRLTGWETADGFRCAVRQIAGLIARRIVAWGGPGTAFAKGDRFGMIRFGSRVELYLPPDVEIVAQVGQKAIGGETILARKRS